MTAVHQAMLGGVSRLTVSVDDINAGGFAPGPSYTPAANTIVRGGIPSYTYSWTRLSGDTQIEINSPALQNPEWYAFGPSGETFISIWRVTVTDATGTTATDNATISISFF